MNDQEKTLKLVYRAAFGSALALAYLLILIDPMKSLAASAVSFMLFKCLLFIHKEKEN